MVQCEYDLERCDSSEKQQEEFGHVFNQRKDDIERFIQQHQKQILELEIELIRLDNQLLHSKFPSLPLGWFSNLCEILAQI